MWALDPPFDLLATFSLAGGSIPISLGVEPAERFFYVGTNKGEVFFVPLFRKRGEMGGVAGELEAVGGGGAGAAPIKLEGCVVKHT
jgi:pre-rRNA-processing protein IPI3